MTLKRLNKVLAHAGICSRRKADQMIFDGQVKVNSKVVLTPQLMVDPIADEIRLDNEILPKEEKKVYFVLNKPIGYICTTSRLKPNQKLILDLFKDYSYRLFTVGRLDKDTSGLIIITNDGEIVHKIIHPSSNIQKEYLVKTREFLTAEHLKKIKKGCRIEGKWVKPVNVVKVRKGTLKVTVKEGKKHEVRILIKNAELELVELSRIRIGNLHLGLLPIGSYKKIEREALEKIYS